jgi:hypothetical protein
MPGLDPAPIFYNTRFIEFCFTLLSLLHDTALSPGLTINVADATFTQVVAELVLRNGDPSTAAYLFAYSLAIDVGLTYAKPSMEDYELSEPTEVNMALWFYGLLHEIGHVRSVPLGDAAALREHVKAVLPDTLARLDLTEEIINSEMHRLDAEGIRHSMLPDHFLTEAAADHFATIAVWNATIDVLTSRGQGLKPIELAVDVMGVFQVIMFLNLAGEWSRGVTQPWLASKEDSLLQVSTAVRSDIVFTTLVSLIREQYPPKHRFSRQPPPPTDEEIAEALEAYINESEDKRYALERGLRLARIQAKYLADRALYVVNGLRTKLRESPHLTLELERFLGLADALEVNHPDIEGLRKLLQNRSYRPPVREFYTLRLRHDDGTALPFGVDLDPIYLMLVFTSKNKRYAGFRSYAETMTPYGTRVEDMVIEASWQWDIGKLLADALPPTQSVECRVLVEGCASFENALRRVPSVPRA